MFLGHYWMESIHSLLVSTSVCLDYSVAKPGGKLVAYQWNGEKVIRPEGYIWTERAD